MDRPDRDRGEPPGGGGNHEQSQAERTDDHAEDGGAGSRGAGGPFVDPAPEETVARATHDERPGSMELSAVRKAYGPVVAVDGVDLTVDAGTLHLLVGPNGSGKTTMLRLLLGLTRPTGGRVRRPDATVGAGFQRPTFYPSLTVGTNVDVFGDVVGAPPGWRRQLLDRLGLERVTERRAGDLSGGYAKKLDLALALLGRPAHLLLDEPLGDLDDVTRESVVEFLASYRDGGRTVLVSTHRVRAFAGRVDRLTVVDRGAVAFDADGDRLARAVADAGSVPALYRAVLDGDAADDREHGRRNP